MTPSDTLIRLNARMDSEFARGRSALRQLGIDTTDVRQRCFDAMVRLRSMRVHDRPTLGSVPEPSLPPLLPSKRGSGHGSSRDLVPHPASVDYYFLDSAVNADELLFYVLRRIVDLTSRSADQIEDIVSYYRWWFESGIRVRTDAILDWSEMPRSLRDDSLRFLQEILDLADQNEILGNHQYQVMRRLAFRFNLTSGNISIGPSYWDEFVLEQMSVEFQFQALQKPLRM